MACKSSEIDSDAIWEGIIHYDKELQFAEIIC